VVAGLTALIDASILCATGLVIYAFYLGWAQDTYPAYMAAVGITVAVTIGAFYLAGLYDISSWNDPIRQITRIALVCAMVFLVVVALAFALKVSAQFSRVWAFAWFFSAIFLVCVARMVGKAVIASWARAGKLTRNVIIVGGGEQAQKLIGILQKEKNPWVRILGIFDDRSNRVSAEIGGYPVRGNLDDLVRYARENRCDDILVALPWLAEQRIVDILQKLKALPAYIRLSPDLAGLHFLRCSYDHYGGVPLLTVMEKPFPNWQYVVKSLEDWLLLALLLPSALPLMLVIAALIKLDSSGPVFFRQKRFGFNNQLIEVFKFRTMYREQQDDDAQTLTKRNDPRVTRVGSFLRRTSLDELPQLINVLKGDMSIVGPRPHAIKASAAGKLYEEVVAEYAVRHKVKPGITGWAQANGWRGETDTVEKIATRVKYDIYYIENWSLILDLVIVFRTIWICLRRKNAY